MSLDYSYNSIEDLFYKPLKEKQKEPMSSDLSGTFIHLGLAKGLDIPKEEKPFLYQLIEKRLEHVFTFKMTEPRAILLICAVAESAGNAIMYLWYLQGWCKENNVRELDFDLISTRIFPMGFFPQSTLQAAWDAQKVKIQDSFTDNLLDYTIFGKTLQFES
jgi:hypothetical protein